MGAKTLLAALLTVALLPLPAGADLDLPVENGIVTSGIGWRLDPFGSGKHAYHRGIDIAVPVGTPVKATRRGTVLFSGTQGGYGATVIIEHDNGDRTLYGHNSLVSASIGQRVEAGTVIAFAGNTGRSTGPHVHYEILPTGSPRIGMAAAEASKEPLSDRSNNIRISHEQRLEETVNSILRRINTSSIASAPVGGSD